RAPEYSRCRAIGRSHSASRQPSAVSRPDSSFNSVLSAPPFAFHDTNVLVDLVERPGNSGAGRSRPPGHRSVAPIGIETYGILHLAIASSRKRLTQLPTACSLFVLAWPLVWRSYNRRER